MGIFSRKPQVIEAQYAPQVMGENMPALYNAIVPRVSRHDAMTVPSVSITISAQAKSSHRLAGSLSCQNLSHHSSRLTGS